MNLCRYGDAMGSIHDRRQWPKLKVVSKLTWEPLKHWKEFSAPIDLNKTSASTLCIHGCSMPDHSASWLHNCRGGVQKVRPQVNAFINCVHLPSRFPYWLHTFTWVRHITLWELQSIMTNFSLLAVPSGSGYNSHELLHRVCSHP